jgi:hypothetical protein
MFQTQCANCGQPRGFARRLGFGTFFMVLITFGLWLFVIPFYPKRCSVCGCVRSSTNIKDAVAQRSPWEIIGLVVVVLVILVAVFSNKSEDKPTPTSITDNGSVSSAVAPANVETASHVENHELKVSPNYFGGNPVSDGRTYSIALIAASEIPVGTELFAQGKIVSFGFASVRSRPFAVLEDEQQTEKMLLCAMGADEGAEVISLYHLHEAVQVYGEYMGILSIAGNPSMPTFSNCKVASPTDKVVRPQSVAPVATQMPEATSTTTADSSVVPSEKDTNASIPEATETDTLTGVYSGKVHNTSARLSATFDTMIQVEQGSAISGCMRVHRPLYGSGRLSGESRPLQVTFSVPSSVGVIRFTGTRTGESIAGTYVVQRNGISAEYGEFELHRDRDLPAAFNTQNCPNDYAVN